MLGTSLHMQNEVGLCRMRGSKKINKSQTADNDTFSHILLQLMEDENV